MKTTQHRVHFIAIGGSVMHNLALALQKKGYQVTGSDDEILEPSKSRLQQAGLLPQSPGWYPEKITKDVDEVILGMHAKADNPELLKAKELGIKILSLPEYIYQQSIDKQRIVIAGSHGKTTITAMVLHVLNFFNRKFDYAIGAQLEGFDIMVKLSDDAPVVIVEGDEYITSAIDKTPKFIHYQHHIALISGVAWDHINVYPTFDEYVKQFELLADKSPKGGTLIYNENDDLAALICRKEREDVVRVEYAVHKHEIEKGKTFLIHGYTKVPVQVFGKHNMKNISGAKAVCIKLGISEDMFYEAIQSFKGASDRLEVLAQNASTTVFKDFAHTPAKLKATTNAVKKQFPSRELTGVLELYSFSSLNKDFLGQYKETFKAADEPIVYFDPKALLQKQLTDITPEDIKKAFDHPKLQVFTEMEKVKEHLLKKEWLNKNLLLMSSGNFGGMNVNELAKEITGK